MVCLAISELTALCSAEHHSASCIHVCAIRHFMFMVGAFSSSAIEMPASDTACKN
jgi:hypothetical protein